MSVRRATVAIAAAVSVVLGGALTDASSADRPTPQRDAARQAAPDASAQWPARAVGLIIQTKTKQAPRDLVAHTQSAIGRRAEVASARSLSGRISTVRFESGLDRDAVLAAVKDVEKRSDVEWAAPDMVRRPFATVPPVTTNDPYFPNMVHLWDKRSATTSLPSPWPNGGFSTRAPNVWRVPNGKGSPNVVVAVIDTGITNHSDLPVQRQVPGYDFASAWSLPEYGSEDPEFQDNDGELNWDDDPSDPGDGIPANTCGFNHPVYASSWHGTHVAGIAAAEDNNAKGVVGVAPNVKILPIRVVGRCGAIDSDILTAIKWATGGHVDGVPDNPNPADVVNLSLGSDDIEGFLDNDPTLVEAACQDYETYAAAARATGAVLVAAAGNSGIDARFSVPGACSGFFTVGSTSTRGLAAWYSNWGDPLDLSAYGADSAVDGPAYGVVSTYNKGTTGPLGETYERLEGTSMAAPMVSAAAAILYSIGLSTPAEVEAGLLAAHHPLPARDKKYSDFFLGDDEIGDLNCRWVGEASSFACGIGILDLARVQVNYKQPTISGSKRVGQKLTASIGSWNYPSAGFRYQWYANGVKIAGATASTYTAKESNIGQKISVEVTPKVAAFTKLSAMSAQTAALIQALSHSTLSLATTVSHTSQAIATVTVKATGISQPTGSLVIKDGNAVIYNGAFADGNSGKRYVRLPKLSKGYHKITAFYGGSATVTSSVSNTRTIKST